MSLVLEASGVNTDDARPSPEQALRCTLNVLGHRRAGSRPTALHLRPLKGTGRGHALAGSGPGPGPWRRYGSVTRGGRLEATASPTASFASASLNSSKVPG
jgi:hypothetical protein